MRKRTKLVIFLLLALTAAVIIYALFFMGQDVQTSHVALPTSDHSSGTGTTEEPDYTVSTLTRENVQAVLAQLNRAENYSATITINYYWGESSSSSDLQVWVSNGRTRIRSEIGGSTRNVLVSDGMLYIWSDSVSGVYAEPYSGSADVWMRSLSYEDVLDLPVERILNANYQQYSGVDCIYVEYRDEPTNYVNRIYVSVSTGLLMGAETYENDVLAYRMVSSVPELSVPDEELFTPPDA